MSPEGSGPVIPSSRAHQGEAHIITENHQGEVVLTVAVQVIISLTSYKPW